MIINHNISALNTHRQLANNTNAVSKSLEKLSSGLRINRAGDDAAGLAISEKMRGQIRGLEMASKNAQDGISLIQTAEGALNETHAILQRMRELAVQSANDTNTDADRQALQDEMNQLAEELTRIADNTEFNTQNLLGGKFKATFHIGANEGQNITLAIGNMSAQALKVSGNGEGQATYEINGNDATLIGTANFDNLAINAGEQTVNVVKIDNIMVGTNIANYGLTNDKGEVVAISADGKTYNLLEKATSTDKLATATVSSATGASIVFDDKVINGTVTFTATEDTNSTITNIKATATIDVDGLDTGTYTVVSKTFDGTEDYFEGISWNTTTTGTSEAYNLIDSVLLNENNELIAVSLDGNDWYLAKDLDFTADVSGGNTDFINGAEVAFTVNGTLTDGQSLTIKANGGIDISSQAAADKAITTIQNAIDTVSAERSKLGAVQNRLEHTINNLGTSAENLTAAESRIRDVDMAKEMMEFTKNNILTQAAQAMLAQANQTPQGVLQLLR